jgi:glycosyltransferase involved in cell wall biosynthesis
MHTPRLSICIATRNRAAWLPTTLDNILAEVGAVGQGLVEVVVVDGASSDATPQIVRARAAQHACLRYLPQAENSGIDGDFDKAVALARGEFCWLFSDDDFMVPGAVRKVLAACAQDPDVVVVDAEVRGADLTEVLASRRLKFTGERCYAPGDSARFFTECIDHLSFIGAVVVRRQLWLARERARYFGTEFVHVGVLFQEPLAGHVRVLGEPLVQIRYGVGNWMQRSFEVWMVKWPRLLWSFAWLPEPVRAAATARRPWHHLGAMLGYRAKGWFSRADYLRHIRPVACSSRDWLAGLIAFVPRGVLNRALRVWRVCQRRKRGMFDYELRRAGGAASRSMP